jgi:biotin operon repressor
MISAFKHIRLSGNNLTPIQSAVWDGSSSLRLGFGNSGLAYYSELTGVSGYLQTLINSANADVSKLNNLQGDLYITGGDGITIEVNAGLGEIKVVGNSGYFQGLINTLNTNLNLTGATLSTNLNLTGTTLQTNINTLTTNLATTGNTLATNLATTGNTLATNLATTGNTLATNLATTGNTLATNLNTTGTTLQTNINTLSGYANATFVAKTSNQVFSTSLTPGADAYQINYPVSFGGTIPKVQATLEVSGDVMYNLSIKSIGTAGYTGVLSDNILEDNVRIHTFASTQ